MAELMSLEIEATAELTSEKLPWEVVVGDGRIDVAKAGVGASVLRQLGHRPD
jgi:hypothetical protein